MSSGPSSLPRRAGLAVLAALALAAAVAFVATGEGGGAAGRASDSWGSLAPSPLQRTEVGAARVGDRIYVVGGFISTGGTSRKMVAYDISDDRWLRRRGLPIAVNHPGVTALYGGLYLLGGDLPPEGGEPAKSRRLFRYDPGRNEWAKLPSAPTERGALGLVGIGRRLYAAGGYSLDDQTLTTLEIFDTKRKRWTTGAEMPTGRNHVGAAVLDGDLVVTGGRPGPVNGGLTTVERYDPRSDSWSPMPPLGTARSGHATVAVSGRLVAFGGEELTSGGATIEQVELYDPAANSWSALPEMVTPRHGVGGAARGTRVFALEGGPQPGLTYSSSLEFLDLP